MFHLYDKVYLDFDHNISAHEPRVVVSEQYGSSDGVVQGFATQHAFAKTVGDIIGNDKTFANELEFFQQIKQLASGGRLVVYCDNVALQHLFVAWHKILLNVTADNAWNIWKLFVDKESYRSAVTDTVAHVYYEDIKASTWNQQEFVNMFDTVTVTKDSAWVLSILNSLGIEYLLSSYINGSAAVAPAFESKLKLLARRTLQGELYDTKLNVIANTHNKSLHDALGIAAPASVSDLLSIPSLSILKDPLVWTEAYQLVPSDTHGSADISALTGEKLTAMITAFNLIRQDFQKTQADSPFVKKINWLTWANSESMTAEQIQTVLQSDEFSGCELVDESDHDNVNILLVDWMVMLYKTSSVNLISDLTISL